MSKKNSWIEINYQNVYHNVQVIKGILPKKTTFMAVVKANAYGHGAVEMARYLNSIGITSFAVARIDEGIELRKAGIKGEILILGYTDPDVCQDIQTYNLIQTVVDSSHGKALASKKIPIQVHIKVDTGMHRLGFGYKETNAIISIFKSPFLQVKGIFTHLSVCDSKEPMDITFTKQQIQKFYTLLEGLKKQSMKLPKIHIQSSYGVINYPELSCDYARIGLAMYGTLSPDSQRKMLDVKPVLSIKSRIISMHTIPIGDCVGYGRKYTCRKVTHVATIPIGYADGLPRNLGKDHHYVLVHGQKAPIIGNLCMDQMMVDISKIENISIGDEVTIIGTNEITVIDIANHEKTIPNVVLTRLGNRIPRVYQKEKTYALST